MNLARKNIQMLSAYIAGKPIEETKRELGLSDVIKLASNENPLGPSPKAVSAMRKALASVNRYPDSNNFYLKQKLSKMYGLAPDHFVLGNGSDELIDIVIKTFVSEDENIVTSQWTFLEYEIIARVNNRQVLTAPLKNFTYDLAALREKVNAKTKLVFIANPNNPTGTYVTKDAFDAFVSGLPETAIVVLDEAYDTFIDVRDYPRGSDYVGKKNVLVLKTFSKAYGLSGLRVGYCVGEPRFCAFMEKAKQPFNINSLAQAGALAALDDKAFLRRTRSVVLAGKKYLYEQLAALELAYVPSVANFILVDVGRDCTEVFGELLKRGVIVRDMKQYGLGNFIRVTIGTPRENRRFIAALRQVSAQRG